MDTTMEIIGYILSGIVVAALTAFVAAVIAGIWHIHKKIMK